MVEGGRERMVFAAHSREEIRSRGYKNVDDVALGVSRKVRINTTYIARLVVVAVQAVLIKYPALKADVLIYKGAVYYGGQLLKLVTRWVSLRARREYRNKNKKYTRKKE